MLPDEVASLTAFVASAAAVVNAALAYGMWRESRKLRQAQHEPSLVVQAWMLDQERWDLFVQNDGSTPAFNVTVSIPIALTLNRHEHREPFREQFPLLVAGSRGYVCVGERLGRPSKDGYELTLGYCNSSGETFNKKAVCYPVAYREGRGDRDPMLRIASALESMNSARRVEDLLKRMRRRKLNFPAPVQPTPKQGM